MAARILREMLWGTQFAVFAEKGVRHQPVLDDLHGYAGDGGDVFGFTDVVGGEAFVVVYDPLFGLG